MHVGFVQHFGISGNGGGPRILRTLIENQPFSWVSIVSQLSVPSEVGIRNGREIWIPVRPNTRIDNTRLHYLADCYLSPLYRRGFRRRIECALEENAFDVVHVVPHGVDDWRFAADYCFARQIPVVVSIHDDLRYTQGRSYLRLEGELGRLWLSSSHVFCISDNLGREYCRRFGDRNFEVLTDGVDGVSRRQLRDIGSPIRMYFCGLLHKAYVDNFMAMFNAVTQGELHFVFRGAVPFPEMARYRQAWSCLPYAEDISTDFDSVDLLYLPLPFGKQQDDFVRFSLSTKVVSYLASGLPVIYHGPEFGPLFDMLRDSDAAIFVTSLDESHVRKSLADIRKERLQEIVNNARLLVQQRFSRRESRARFLQSLVHATGRSL